MNIQSKAISVVFDKKINRKCQIDEHRKKSLRVVLSWKELFVWKIFFLSLSYPWWEFTIISLAFELNIESHLLDPQSMFSWSKILTAVPQRSGLESRGHSVTDGKTILSKGKVSTTDFMGFSIQPANANLMLIFDFWRQFPVQKLCIVCFHCILIAKNC